LVTLSHQPKSKLKQQPRKLLQQKSLEGFRQIFNEVAFVEMKPANGEYEPLIGYIVLEQSLAAVDMLGHRLVPIKHMDLKSASQCRYLDILGASNHRVDNGGNVMRAE
jgi:hypothetical protein